MKKIYLSIVAAVSLMFVSCTADWLNTDPSTAVPSDDAIKNIDDAQVALNGIYRLASAHSYYGDNYLYYADCRGEDVQARINKGAGRRVSPYYFFDVTADDNFNITLVWNQPYKVIHQANSLIEKLEDVYKRQALIRRASVPRMIPFMALGTGNCSRLSASDAIS